MKTRKVSRTAGRERRRRVLMVMLNDHELTMLDEARERAHADSRSSLVRQLIRRCHEDATVTAAA